MEPNEKTLIKTTNLSSEIPEDAKQLTEFQAKSYMFDIMLKWRPQRDVWPYTFGVGSLAVFSGFVSGYHNKFLRRTLKMGNTLLVSTTLAVVALPTVLVYATHLTFVTGDVLIQKTKCPVCLETRAMLLQAACCVYPLVLSSIVNISFADRLYLAAVPSMKDHPKEFAKFCFNLYKPMKSTLLVTTLAQMCFAAFIAHCQIGRFPYVAAKLDAGD